MSSSLDRMPHLCLPGSSHATTAASSEQVRLMSLPPSHGVVRYIREVLATPAAHRSVRTFGRFLFPCVCFPSTFLAPAERLHAFRPRAGDARANSFSPILTPLPTVFPCAASVRMDAGAWALEHEGERLALDVTQLGAHVLLKTGGLYMVIGEVLALPSGPFLQARVARNVDGMDVELFGAALKLQRSFLEQKPPPQQM